MAKDLTGGLTRLGEGLDGVEWDILGQRYFPKTDGSSSFAFETNSEPGQFVPVHIHPNQDEFILVQEGALHVKLAGQWSVAKAGDLVRMPKGVPHGYFNKGDVPARALLWVSPPGPLRALFEKLDGLHDIDEVVRLSAEHEVVFQPAGANE